MPKPSGVVDLYNGLIPEMREVGHTLASIGEYTGVSRERIRQILETHYPETKIKTMTELQLACYLNVPHSRLAKLRKQRILSPIKIGESIQWVYDEEEIIKAINNVYERPYCKHCGLRRVPWPRGSYCSECGKEKQRYGYPFMSKEQKKRWNKRVVAWQKRNPDKVKISQKRASDNWWRKKRVEMLKTTFYQIRVNGYELPKGTISKAIAYRGNKIIFSGGLAIYKLHVKKVVVGE